MGTPGHSSTSVKPFSWSTWNTHCTVQKSHIHTHHRSLVTLEVWEIGINKKIHFGITFSVMIMSTQRVPVRGRLQVSKILCLPPCMLKKTVLSLALQTSHVVRQMHGTRCNSQNNSKFSSGQRGTTCTVSRLHAVPSFPLSNWETGVRCVTACEKKVDSCVENGEEKRKVYFSSFPFSTWLSASQTYQSLNNCGREKKGTACSLGDKWKELCPVLFNILTSRKEKPRRMAHYPLPNRAMVDTARL